jgi:hypothetical protein
MPTEPRSEPADDEPSGAEVVEYAGSLDLVAVERFPLDDPHWRALLKQMLAERIELWLRHDRPRLAQALYRLDVDEGPVAAALSYHAGHDAAERVAELVLERVESRVRNRDRLEAMLRA